MQKVITFLSITIGFLIGFKSGKKFKDISAINCWDRALTHDEINTLYKAEKIKEKSYPKKV